MVNNPTAGFYKKWPYPGRFVRRMEFWSRLPGPFARMGYSYWGKKLLRREKYRRVYGEIISGLEERFGSPLHVLDAGCGTGEESFRLAGAFPGRVRIDAFDLSPRSLEVAGLVHERIRHLPGLDQVHFRRGNVLEPVEGEYHFIISNGVLHHTGNTELGLRQITRPLLPGGILYLYLYSSYGWLDDDAQRKGLHRLGRGQDKEPAEMQDIALELKLGDGRERWRKHDPMKSASWMDCFCNPCVERFTIEEVFEMLERCDLEFHGFDPDNTLEPASENPTVAKQLAELPPLDAYSIMEQLHLPECHELFAIKREPRAPA